MFYNRDLGPISDSKEKGIYPCFPWLQWHAQQKKHHVDFNQGTSLS